MKKYMLPIATAVTLIYLAANANSYIPNTYDTNSSSTVDTHVESIAAYTAGTNGQVLSYSATAATYEPTNVAFHTFVSSLAFNTYYTNLSGGEEIVRLSADGVSTGAAVGEVGLNAYVDRVFQQTWGFTDTTTLGFTTFGSVTIFVEPNGVWSYSNNATGSGNTTTLQNETVMTFLP
jgi:hypothetical protein